MNDFFGFDFVGILILLCILIYLLFDFVARYSIRILAYPHCSRRPGENGIHHQKWAIPI
jgi:hypothetical protein